jgi:hypothetical protein
MLTTDPYKHALALAAAEQPDTLNQISQEKGSEQEDYGAHVGEIVSRFTNPPPKARPYYH